MNDNKSLLRPEEYAKNYFSSITEILNKIDVRAIDKFINILIEARERGSRIYFIGNGGSAATANHFVNDLAFGTESWNKPFRAMSLTDNSSVMTALANDFGYESVFYWQLKAHLVPRDVVVGISASGNSPNIVKAFEYANNRDAVTVAITGFDGGKLHKIANHSIHAPTQKGDYGLTEDIHLILNHMVSTYLYKVCGVIEVAKTRYE